MRKNTSLSRKITFSVAFILFVLYCAFILFFFVFAFAIATKTAGVVRPSQKTVQVIIGTQVQFVADEFKKLCFSVFGMG